MFNEIIVPQKSEDKLCTNTSGLPSWLRMQQSGRNEKAKDRSLSKIILF